MTIIRGFTAMAAGLVLAAMAAAPVHAQTVRFIAIDYAPFIYEEGGQVKGFFHDVTKAAAEKAGIPFKAEVQAPSRLYETAKAEAVIIPQLGRIPQRENQFQWVASVLKDKNCFLTPKGAAAIDSLDDAKKAQGVAVLSNGALAQFLVSQSMSNVEAASPNILNARKLEAKRVATWYNSEIGASFIFKQAGIDPAGFQCGKPIQEIDFWIGASLTTPKDVVEKLRAAYDALNTSGEVERIYKATLK